MVTPLRKDIEEAVFKRRLLYDGHGQGDDKRLLNLMKNVSKLYLSDEPINAPALLAHINAAIETSEKHEKLTHVFDRSMVNLEKAIEDKSQHMEKVKKELKDLVLELEYVEKLKKVDEFPNCNITQQAMQNIDKKKQQLMEKLERQRNNLNCLIEACKNLKKVLDEDDSDCVMLTEDES